MSLDEYQRKGHCAVTGVLTPASVAVARDGVAALHSVIHGSAEPKSGANTLHLSDVALQPFPWMRRFVFWLVCEFTKSEAYRLYEALYGNAVAFPLEKCAVRYQRPDYRNSHLPYHQDVDASKADAHMINCWTALDDCGKDAPGLEIIDAPFREVYGDLFLSETFEQAGAARWQEKHDAVIARLGNHGVSRPQFKAGDGLVFDHYAMHKTYFDPAMTRPRRSIEFRACNAEQLVKICGPVDRITVTRGTEGLEYSYSARYSQPEHALEFVRERAMRKLGSAVDAIADAAAPAWLRLRGR